LQIKKYKLKSITYQLTLSINDPDSLKLPASPDKIGVRQAGKLSMTNEIASLSLSKTEGVRVNIALLMPEQ